MTAEDENYKIVHHLDGALHTCKKIGEIFLACKKIQKGLGAKSYMRKGFLIYEEMRKYLVIYCIRKSLVIFDFCTQTPSKFSYFFKCKTSRHSILKGTFFFLLLFLFVFFIQHCFICRLFRFTLGTNPGLLRH
jgi:hypothetical protein